MRIVNCQFKTMETWRLLVLSLLFAKMCKLEDISTLPSDSTTFLPLATAPFENFKTVSFQDVLNSTNLTGSGENSTVRDAHIKLQKIANITISQFLNNQTRRNYSLSELLELKELADSIMDSNFMIPNFVKKSNSHLLALPSATMVNLASAILKSDFMPMGILQPKILKNKDSEKLQDVDLERKEHLKENKTMLTTYNATMDEALETMNFHRKMMNEFLCRNYVAESILDALERDASIFSDEFSNGFSDRMGESEPEATDPVAEMITDLGSTRYRDWLDRSAVLTDVYKNMGGFEPNPYITRPTSPSDLPILHRGDKRKHKDDDDDEDEDDEDDVDEKEKRKKPSKKKKKKKKKKPKPEVVDDAIEEEEEEEDEEADNDGEADSVLQVVDSHILSGGQHYEEEYSGWNILRFGFEDFYDTALTAMAFLTFGIFTLQVFINLITNANAPRMGILVSNTTSAPPVNKRRRALNLEQIRILEATERLPEEFTANPKTMTTTLVEENMKNTENEATDLNVSLLKTPVAERNSISEKPTFEIIFGINVTPSIDLDPDFENTGQEPPVPRYIGPEDVVAKFALVTIRAALNKDVPRCLQAALCRANRATLQLEGPPRLWLPMWSVAMSWMAQRAGGIPGSAELIYGALDNLRASVLGLAGVKCEEIYPPCLH